MAPHTARRLNHTSLVGIGLNTAANYQSGLPLIMPEGTVVIAALKRAFAQRAFRQPGQAVQERLARCVQQRLALLKRLLDVVLVAKQKPLQTPVVGALQSLPLNLPLPPSDYQTGGDHQTHNDQQELNIQRFDQPHRHQVLYKNNLPVINQLLACQSLLTRRPLARILSCSVARLHQMRNYSAPDCDLSFHHQTHQESPLPRKYSLVLS